MDNKTNFDRVYLVFRDEIRVLQKFIVPTILYSAFDGEKPLSAGREKGTIDVVYDTEHGEFTIHLKSMSFSFTGDKLHITERSYGYFLYGTNEHGLQITMHIIFN